MFGKIATTRQTKKQNKRKNKKQKNPERIELIIDFQIPEKRDIYRHYLFEKYRICVRREFLTNQFLLTLYAPTPQNGQKHSNNLSAICRRIVLSAFDHFVGLTFKGLILYTHSPVGQKRYKKVFN